MTCSVEDCYSPVYVQSRQLCSGHYQQWHRGAPFTPVREKGHIYTGGPERMCNECGVVKDIDQFYKRTGSGIPWSKCKECVDIVAWQKRKDAGAKVRPFRASV